MKKLSRVILMLLAALLLITACSPRTESAAASPEVTASETAAPTDTAAPVETAVPDETAAPAEATAAPAESAPFTYDETLGSAHTPEGTTLIISVFANDVNYSWDFTSDEDLETRDLILSNLHIASEYLTQMVAYYGKTASFLYDFMENPDLCYEANFDADTTEGDAATAEQCMNQFIDTSIDSDALREKYRADNIIYFMILNTDEASQAITCTRSYYEGMERPYEIVFLYNVDEGMVNCPAVYAHEMLHAFGAPDLYSVNETYNITQEFVDYVQQNLANDLMLTCSDIETGDYVYDRITNEVSELDAFYIGLTDTCALADEFQLTSSQHILGYAY